MKSEEKALKRYKNWLATRPANVRKVAKNFNPLKCYRAKDNDGHYALVSFEENGDGTVTLKIAHGSDSYFPGTMVFGVHPENLVLCDCGKWEPATQEDLRVSKRRIDEAIHIVKSSNAINN